MMAQRKKILSTCHRIRLLKDCALSRSEAQHDMNEDMYIYLDCM